MEENQAILMLTKAGTSIRAVVQTLGRAGPTIWNVQKVKETSDVLITRYRTGQSRKQQQLMTETL